MEHKFETSKTFDGPSGNNYNELTLLRDEERADAIRRGLIDDPERPKALEDAQVFRGTCMDMCPFYEREQREYQNDVKRWEINQDTGRIDRSLAVKAFHRPAAGNEQALPSDVRPPAVLSTTLDYLVDKIVSASDPLDKDTHGFVRDRTRSIRQDFTLQNERGTMAIACHERIVRFHILSLHQMCETDGFDAHQEMEQLRKTLQSLAEYYDDQRHIQTEFPNEAEFRAYHVLTRMRDPDVLRHVQTLPRPVRNSSILRHALKLYKYAQRSNEEVGRFKPPNCEGSHNAYSRFFRLVSDQKSSYMVACLCETQFNDIRKGALKSMRKAFITAVRAPSVAELVTVLGCDNEDEVELHCEQYGIVVRPDDEDVARPILNKASQFDESRPDMKQHFSWRLVEAKRAGLSFAQIINGTAINTVGPVSPIPLKRRPISGTAFNLPSAAQFNRPLSDFSDLPKAERHQAQRQQFYSTPTHQKLRAIEDEKPKVVQFSTVPLVQAVKTTSVAVYPATVDLPDGPPIKPEDEPLLSNVVDKVFQRLMHEEIATVVTESLCAREIEESERNQMVESLAESLFEGLLRNQLHQVVCEGTADHWRAKKDIRRAWHQVKESSVRLQERKRIAREHAEAEKRRRDEYEAAFRELNAEQAFSNPRKRVRRSIGKSADDETIVKAKEVSQRFWSALNLESEYLPLVRTEPSPRPWRLLIALADTTSMPWFRAKFGMQDDVRLLSTGGNSFEIRLVENCNAGNLQDVGALVFQCTNDAENDRGQFLNLVQRIAEDSDRRFPVMMLRFDEISDVKALAHQLMVPEVLSDRKSPVTDCQFFAMESMQDICKFEALLKRIFRSTSSELSPLALERAAQREQESRRLEVMPRQRKSLMHQVRLRNSFYDTTVSHNNNITTSPSARPCPTVEHMVPRQLSDFQKAVQSAKELLANTTTVQ